MNPILNDGHPRYILKNGIVIDRMTNAQVVDPNITNLVYNQHKQQVNQHQMHGGYQQNRYPQSGYNNQQYGNPYQQPTQHNPYAQQTNYNQLSNNGMTNNAYPQTQQPGMFGAMNTQTGNSNTGSIFNNSTPTPPQQPAQQNIPQPVEQPKTQQPETQQHKETIMQTDNTMLTPGKGYNNNAEEVKITISPFDKNLAIYEQSVFTCLNYVVYKFSNDANNNYLVNCSTGDKVFCNKTDFTTLHKRVVQRKENIGEVPTFTKTEDLFLTKLFRKMFPSHSLDSFIDDFDEMLKYAIDSGEFDLELNKFIAILDNILKTYTATTDDGNFQNNDVKENEIVRNDKIILTPEVASVFMINNAKDLVLEVENVKQHKIAYKVTEDNTPLLYKILFRHVSLFKRSIAGIYAIINNKYYRLHYSKKIFWISLFEY